MRRAGAHVIWFGSGSGRRRKVLVSLNWRSLWQPFARKISWRVTFYLLLALVLLSLFTFLVIRRTAAQIELTGTQSLIMQGELLTDLYASSEDVRIAVLAAQYSNNEATPGAAQAGQKQFLARAVADLFRQPDVLYVVFYNLKGQRLFESGTRGFHPSDFSLPAPVGQQVLSGFMMSKNGVPAMDVLRPIKLGRLKQAEESAPDNQVGWIRIGLSPARHFALVSYVNNIGYFIIGFLFILIIGTGYFLQRTITRPIIRIAAEAKRIGQEDGAGKIVVRSEDELAVLAQAFNEMALNTRQQIAHTKLLVDSLTETIGLITKTTNDIYAISAQQSSGATEQAASVYQASSTSKEIAASATRIADTAEEMAGYSRQTSSACDVGKVELNNAVYQVNDVTEKVELVAVRMVELGEKSQKISGIIDIINEISEQTNLLSLNAAIEAAGAGEGGKRFSVVAQEIRRLAGRTLDATLVVRQLVEEIQSATNTTVMVTEQSMKSSREATQCIDRMNQSFQNILELVEQALKASTEITLSTRQQTTACEQMVSTIMEVSEVASEVEKGAKETEQALSRLRELSADLKTLAQAALSGEL
jgi:methyl-accepting chemotaxis protein